MIRTKNFGIAISCIDGRVQLPIIHWFRETYRVDYVDVITEPGVERLFSDRNKAQQIRTKIIQSLNTNKARTIIISGHHDCEVNPISKKDHIAQIKNAIDTIKSWKLSVLVIGVWVNEDWEIEIVS